MTTAHPFDGSADSFAAIDQAFDGHDAAASADPGPVARAPEVPAAADVVTSAAGVAHDTIDRVAAQAAPQVQRLHDSVSQANDLIHERGESARQISEAWAGGLRATVRENPLAAVAAALAFGLLIARLSR